MTTPSNDLARQVSLNRKIHYLLTKPKITLTDVADFSVKDKDRLGEIIRKRLNKLSGAAKDEFFNKIDQLLPAETRDSFWEHNQQLITAVISNLIQQFGVMPSKTDIADETGLSRQTVAKHLKEYKLHPEFKAQTEQFKFLSHKMLANVFKAGSKGDMRAARLYFEMIGALAKAQSNTVVNEQNNYIQINNTILSQENLKQLSADELQQIELIVTGKHKVMA